MELKKFNDKAFLIYIYYNKKHTPVTLKNCFCNDVFENFIVYGKKATITIRNNRPELRRLEKTNHKLKWQMIVGPTDIPMDFLTALFNAMDDYIENVIEGGYANRQSYISKKR